MYTLATACNLCLSASLSVSLAVGVSVCACVPMLYAHRAVGKQSCVCKYSIHTYVYIHI